MTIGALVSAMPAIIVTMHGSARWTVFALVRMLALVRHLMGKLKTHYYKKTML